MKRAGIVTIYDLNNYGNRLQNYAVDFVCKSLNFDCTNFVQHKNFFPFKLLLVYILKRRFKDAKRLFKFINFQCKHFKDEFVYGKTESDREEYDFFICGSDQIWHPDWLGNEISCYTAAFADYNKRISFSASFGVSEIPIDKKEAYSKYLSEMKAISVREHRGAEIIKELTGRDVPVLVDPTLMLDKADWQKIAKKPKFDIADKYLLTYFLGEVSSQRRDYIKNVARENNLKIIDLSAKNPNKFWYKVGPAEFVWLIEHSSVFLTDSFHGCVFSLLMEIPFIVFDRDENMASMSSRIDTLLKTFRLENAKYSKDFTYKIPDISYEHIPQILECERSKVRDYLKTALEINEV